MIAVNYEPTDTDLTNLIQRCMVQHSHKLHQSGNTDTKRCFVRRNPSGYYRLGKCGSIPGNRVFHVKVLTGESRQTCLPFCSGTILIKKSHRKATKQMPLHLEKNHSQ
jgi:hypothetical protein